MGVIQQVSRLICLPDESGDFFAFKAKIAPNKKKSEKTGFGVADQAASEPVDSFIRSRYINVHIGIIVLCREKEKVP